jgi:hypothetical protein
MIELAGGIDAVGLLLSSPSAAFARLRERPRWVGLLLLCAGSAAVASWISLPQTLEEEARILGDVVERFDIPAERADEMLRSVPDPGDVTPAELVKRVGGAALGTAAFLLLGFGAFHVVARVCGAQPSFRQSGAVFFLAAIASAAGTLLRGVLIRLMDTIDVTLGPGALWPGLDPVSVTASFLNVFDVFSVLNLWLLAIGAGVVFGASRGTAWGIAGAWWILKSIVVFSMMLFRVWISGHA